MDYVKTIRVALFVHNILCILVKKSNPVKPSADRILATYGPNFYNSINLKNLLYA